MTAESVIISTGAKLSREQLALVSTPPGTPTHKPIPHIEVVNVLLETLGFRAYLGRPGRIRGLPRWHEDVWRHGA
jgi:hypothetical protein